MSKSVKKYWITAGLATIVAAAIGLIQLAPRGLNPRVGRTAVPPDSVAVSLSVGQLTIVQRLNIAVQVESVASSDEFVKILVRWPIDGVTILSEQNKLDDALTAEQRYSIPSSAFANVSLSGIGFFRMKSRIEAWSKSDRTSLSVVLTIYRSTE